MKFISISLILITTLLSTGCSTYNYRPEIEGAIKTQNERLAHLNTLDCCVTPEMMSKEMLREETIHFTMLENSHTTDFNDFKSHYKLFDISKLSGTTYYKLVTYTQEKNTSPIQLFLPKIYILDENYKILRESDPNHLSFVRWSIRGNNHFELFIKIDKQSSPNQKYILITASQVPYGEHIDYSRTYNSFYTNIIGNQAYTVSEPKNDSLSFITSPSGVLTIENLGVMDRPLNDSAYRF
ncbi:hypothetical protein [uncultured Sunxiuqinia sp.]|uniref:hypothetical protein n=1 Tax=Pseudomonadati TaxID=3379134 RepID=UPI0030D77460|tara:strand:- start:1013 stop:1729 length:717 start_codon:yes stop_codon:yes gene_type:complete